jgi:hypothetical protein
MTDPTTETPELDPIQAQHAAVIQQARRQLADAENHLFAAPDNANNTLDGAIGREL